MKKLSLKKYLFFSAIIALGILIDQISKLLAVKFLEPIDTLPIIKNVIHLTYVENRGAAFGMLANSRWVFMSISTVAILAMLVFLYAGFAQNLLYEISVAMIIAGGIGNMIDRTVLGYVVDMIDFRLIDFAVFNGADSLVCVGAGILILALLLDIAKESKAVKAKKEKDDDTDGK